MSALDPKTAKLLKTSGFMLSAANNMRKMRVEQQFEFSGLYLGPSGWGHGGQINTLFSRSGILFSFRCEETGLIERFNLEPGEVPALARRLLRAQNKAHETEFKGMALRIWVSDESELTFELRDQEESETVSHFTFNAEAEQKLADCLVHYCYDITRQLSDYELTATPVFGL